MKITVHVKGIAGSNVVRDDEHAGALFGAIVEINGHLFDRVTAINNRFEEGFAYTDITFLAGEIDVVTHTSETWQEIARLADEAEDKFQDENTPRQAKLREPAERTHAIQADGRTVARH